MRATPKQSSSIRLKRIYVQPSPDDGLRILVDRLWPRGISKEWACLTCWMPDLAPSTALRQWFQHDSQKWSEFVRCYHAELQSQEEGIRFIRHQAERLVVTMLYAARQEHLSHATALKAYVLHG